jgi:hypothetical protein
MELFKAMKRGAAKLVDTGFGVSSGTRKTWLGDCSYKVTIIVGEHTLQLTSAEALQLSDMLVNNASAASKLNVAYDFKGTEVTK